MTPSRLDGELARPARDAESVEDQRRAPSIKRLVPEKLWWTRPCAWARSSASHTGASSMSTGSARVGASSRRSAKVVSGYRSVARYGRPACSPTRLTGSRASCWRRGPRASQPAESAARPAGPPGAPGHHEGHAPPVRADRLADQLACAPRRGHEALDEIAIDDARPRAGLDRCRFARGESHPESSNVSGGCRWRWRGAGAGAGTAPGGGSTGSGARGRQGVSAGVERRAVSAAAAAPRRRATACRGAASRRSRPTASPAPVRRPGPSQGREGRPRRSAGRGWPRSLDSCSASPPSAALAARNAAPKASSREPPSTCASRATSRGAPCREQAQVHPLRRLARADQEARVLADPVRLPHEHLDADARPQPALEPVEAGRAAWRSWWPPSQPGSPCPRSAPVSGSRAGRARTARRSALRGAAPFPRCGPPGTGS